MKHMIPFENKEKSRAPTQTLEKSERTWIVKHVLHWNEQCADERMPSMVADM